MLSIVDDDDDDFLRSLSLTLKTLKLFHVVVGAIVYDIERQVDDCVINSRKISPLHSALVNQLRN